MSDSFATPRTVAHGAPLSLGFHRQEYWSGLPFPSLGDLPNPGIEPESSALQVNFFFLPLNHHEKESVSDSVMSDSLKLHGL